MKSPAVSAGLFASIILLVANFYSLKDQIIVIFAPKFKDII